MKTNYFNLTGNTFNNESFEPVKVLGSHQHAAFATGDVVFDWQKMEMPRGTTRVQGATTIIRSKGDGGATPQPAGVDFIISRGKPDGSSPGSLGTVNTAAMLTPNNDIIGVIPAANADIVGGAQVVITSSVSSPLIIEQYVNDKVAGTASASGVAYGNTYIYVAGIAAGAIDLTSLSRLNMAGGITAEETTALTTTGTDARQIFIKGDVITCHDDADVAEVASTDSATGITLTNSNGAALAQSDFLYNLVPIRFALHCTK